MKSAKISDTSIRVLETLKVLVKKNSSIQEIISHFEKKDPNNRVYTNEVILKYINTLKVFGFRFTKEKDKYVIMNAPNQFEFNEEELKLIYLIEKSAQLLPEQKIKSEVNMFLQILEKRFTDNTKILAHSLTKPDFLNLKLNYEKYSEQISVYEKYCAEGQKLKVTYQTASKKENSIVVESNEIKYNGDKVYLSVYNPLSAKIQDINLEDIIKIVQLPLRANPTNMLSTTTFKLKDKLAEGYKLHDGEKVLQVEKNGNIVVINQKEDKTMLLKRLMRYGSNCEVLSPKNLREEMIQMIDGALSIYESR